MEGLRGKLGVVRGACEGEDVTVLVTLSATSR
jgi:hypothetical protein